MYIIKWTNSYVKDFLQDLSATKAKWGNLSSAKFFLSKKEAELYIIDTLTGERAYGLDQIQILYYHPFNKKYAYDL